MNFFNPELFEYRALYKNKEVYFSIATEEEANIIEDMYTRVGINCDNYKEIMNVESENNFSIKGGMFTCLREQEIKDHIKSGESCFLVAKLEDEIIAMLWIALSDPVFEGFEPNVRYFSFNRQRCESLEASLESGKVTYLRDIIIDKKAAGLKIYMILYYIAISAMLEKGYMHSLGEVYKINSYYDKKKKRKYVINLLNEKSFRTIFMSLGRLMGKNQERTIENECFRAVIDPKVILFENELIKDELRWNIEENQIELRNIGGM